MIKEAITHETMSEYAYALDENTLIIKIKTAKNDINNINILYADKYKIIKNLVRMNKSKMEKISSDDLFDYYEIELKFDVISMTYYFEIISGDEKIYYGNNKFFHSKSNQTYMHFNVPVLAKEDIFKTPTWLNGAIGYQIFPDRFAKKGGYEIGYNEAPISQGKHVISKNISAWDSEPTTKNFTGGNLQGIISKLDYLKDLGVTLLYLTPIFKAATSHRYDTIDYFEIDPMLGTKADFKELVDTVHKNGMKIVLDGVFNHSGYNFEPFQDVVMNGENSKYKEWFSIKHFPVITEPTPNYKTFAHYFAMPKLNLSNPETEEFALSVIEYWVKDFDIDGWRLDVADEVSHDFWRKARKRIHEVKKDSILTGEIWYDSRAWLKGDQFDTVMNYLFYEACIDFIAKKQGTSQEFLERIGKVRGIYKIQAYRSMWNLIGSHDTPRFLSQSSHKIDRLKLAVLVQMTIPGIPFIYYGDEIGMDGEKDPDCRKGMKWENINSELLQYYKKLISIRKNNPILREGEMKFLDFGDEVLAYEMCKNNKIISVIVNLSKKKVIIPNNKTLTNLLDNKRYITSFELKSGESLLLKETE